MTFVTHLKNNTEAAYGFDDIGNRKTTTRDSRPATYSPNILNQFTSRTVPGYVNVLGTATNPATVTLWSQESAASYTPTSRKGDYFRGEMPLNNATGSVWLTITNVAVLSNSTGADIIASTTGKLFVAQSPETFSHDLDGNLTNSGRWAISWDAENRATAFTRVSSAPSGSKVKLDCTYDSQWRRTQKIVSTWNGSAYVAQSTNKFVYDGWNLVAILDSQSSILYSFTWGLDASGTLQGAGGVGGLISMTVHQGANAGTYFYCYDGNHNVAALVNAANGTLGALYDCDAFLGIIRATGALAFLNPFVGSTKFYDWETSLYYYGYRFYDPIPSRFLSRDPIGELGGNNLYDFCGNDSINCFDLLGLEWKIKRNRNNARGIAWATSSSDTFNDLAVKLRLDTKDYQKWLQTSDTTPQSCKIYGIPNTVFVDIGPRYRSDQPWYVRYAFRISLTQTFLRQLAQRTGDIYEQHDFKVVRTEPATGTDIRNHLGSPDIYAYVFSGHGANGAINSTEDDAVFPGRYTQYGIQYMGLLACGSALDNSGEGMNSYPSNVARRGQFFGSINNYTALLAIIIGAGDFIWIWTPGTN